MFANFSEWWDVLTVIEKIYWIIAIPFSIIFLFQMVMTFFGGDVDDGIALSGHTDVDVDGDSGIVFQFITIKNLIGFFTIFSWIGIACLKAGFSNPISIVVSIVSGILMMVIMASIYYFMSKLSESGTLNIKNSVGKQGEVYLFIPAKRSGKGKVNINVQGSVREFDAITDDENEIQRGALITVVDVIESNILLVKR
ncbi:MAG: hypothetical protein A2033_13455 [Bacteroidetes bacterium GWA2_31_9]|nr:MAG: hypothetical protein A2033_13455 [Bacteroidetes bacterium GWA2_31_9]